jgi:hypothetical protein
MIVMTVRAICHPKCYFGGSLDFSAGMDKLFRVIELNEGSKLLIIFIDLGNVRNMIHLSDQDQHDGTSLFSRQDLRDTIFQDSIIKGLCMASVSSRYLRKYMD